jgi:hypothetical protein
MGETMKSATALKALSALLMLGLGACATTQERMDGWVGTTDAHLLSAWGAPDAAEHRVIGASTTCRQGGTP